VTTTQILGNVALGVVLVCITVFIQIALTFLVLRFFRRVAPPVEPRPGLPLRVLAVAFLVITILFGHLAQINLWALAFYLLAFFGDFWSAQYFVSETYTTLGYGDLLLPPEHRMLAGWLAITGLLMIGWSTAVFAYLVTKYYEAHVPALERQARRARGR
jgi:hypothetical protein